MNPKITFVLFLFVSILNAQKAPMEARGGEFVFNKNDQPCLTPEQRKAVKQTVIKGITELKSKNKLVFSEAKRGGHPLFAWPIQKASNVTFNDVWAISGYVDHNANFPNQLTDYNCGTITYDTAGGYNHQGVDIYNWPFTWKLMDDDSVEIIAAADGQIIAKHDGEFDRSCNFNNNIWNAVYVQHGDGSVAWYGHMKNGSVTSKNVGDTVAQGEYLGIVGSSGNSTGPHLHFEVYTDASFTQLVDPFSGTCNGMNTDSWWANQIPYSNPNINAVMTHSQAPDVFPTCPTTETTYESNDFDISEDIYLSVFLRDQIANTPLSLKVIRPNGSYLYEWSLNTTTTASSWYYYWFFPVDAVGAWTWEVTYQGQTESHGFNVTDQLSVKEETLKSATIYPNPFNDIVNIKSSAKIKNASIVDVSGKMIVKFEEHSTEGLKKLNLSELSNGMYFIILEGELGQQKTVKLVKQ
ncbi:peptidoglycan DD-metalloendopeptidase family protein [Winogradskyella pulchriflava]|uniref:Peptidoglycan DD-metalloendopeptidase family protein n=1 Tax=Winogradskyella pulchriflava TaxID=1110688 RepID=A0ABV6Q503_9FLAO